LQEGKPDLILHIPGKKERTEADSRVETKGKKLIKLREGLLIDSGFKWLASSVNASSPYY